jgi:HlyD family secretion protein
MKLSRSFLTPALIGLVVLTAAWGGYKWLRGSGSTGNEVPTVPVQRGDLQITVLQGGEIRALKNYEVKSEIETTTKIMSLISEGYMITEDDIKDGKVLVELDGSDLKDRISTHDIEFQTTVSLYIDADENREIVKSEAQSVERDAKNVALFALMDFEKYLGKNVAIDILKDRSLPENIEAFEKTIGSMQLAARPKADAEGNITRAETTAAVKPAPKPPAGKAVTRLDYVSLLDSDKSTDGDAQQKLSQLKGDVLLQQGTLEQARDTLASSKGLADKNFITKFALKTDEVNHEKVQLALRTAEIALDLFRRYEFPKQCEQYLSVYQEALQKLQRTIRENRSKMAQAQSKFETAKRRYDMELNKKKELEAQLAACTIRAKQPGLVAYGPITNSTIRYSEPIEEGATVRLRQTILTIPALEDMGVHVSVHESQVKKVKLGQRVRVRVDAEPGKELEGKVADVAVLPDSSSSRYTPNLKVYPCSVHIDGAHDWLKPGMNAKVEIIVDSLSDILYVPVQSIDVENDQHFCWVTDSGEMQRRPVTTGQFNDEFIQVLKGLQVGETVALTVPKRSLIEDEGPKTAPDKGKPAKKDPKTVAAK